MAPRGSVSLQNVGLTLRHGAGTSDASQNRSILHDVSLTLHPGTVTALLGRSGSGKTTLLRMVNGLVSPTSGKVLVDGEEVQALSEQALRSLRHRIGYVIQETGLFPHMTILRNVALPLELAGEQKTVCQQQAEELLRMVGLQPEHYAARFPFQLSGGQRQRAGLARALLLKPDFLLLDEPFGALDPLTRLEMQQLLRHLLQQFHPTTLLVTHDLQEAMTLADQIVFVEAGAIAHTLSPAAIALSEHPVVVAYRQAAVGEVGKLV